MLVVVAYKAGCFRVPQAREHPGHCAGGDCGHCDHWTSATAALEDHCYTL